MNYVTRKLLKVRQPACGITCACLAVFLAIAGCSSVPERTPLGVVGTAVYGGKAIQASHVVIPFTENGNTILLEGMLYRDMSLGSWRGIVMTHGRNGPHPLRQKYEVLGYQELNLEMASKGAAVLFVVRRGYGASEGNDSEFLDTPAESGLAAAEDLAAGVQYLKGINGVQPNGIVIMGHSQGGWAALAASTLDISGVGACVNLCGGTNYRMMGSGQITNKVEEDWTKACSLFGNHSRIPTVWVYAENDRNHPSDQVRMQFAEFSLAGGNGVLHILPPYKDNGHNIVAEPGLFLDLVFTDIARLELGSK